jgi:GWxTD domain-containing protein
LSLALFRCSAPPTAEQKSWLQDYYSLAEFYFDENNIDSSLVFLRKCLDIENDYAPAHHLLGKIYLVKDGIYNRRLSAISLKEAIKSDRDNPEYHYALGLTMEKQGFYLNALDQFKVATRLDSSDFRPYVKIARINEKFGLRYDDDKYFQRSLDASSKAAILSGDPSQFYRQAVALYQMGRYDSSASVLSHAICNSDSSGVAADSAQVLQQCWLLLGTIEAIRKNYDSAHHCFEKGRAKLGDMARDEMDDVPYLMTADLYKQYMNENFSAQQRTTQIFWGQIDPDPTTQINERMLEHYARFIHAQLTFSLPERHIPGWKTKRGELYIRYGPPTEQEFSLGAGPSDPPRWTWIYERFGRPAVFFFEDTFLNGEFNFPFPNKNWTADDYARDPGLLANTLGSSNPQAFDFAPGSGPLEFLYMPRQFKGRSGKTDLEIFAAIPYTQLKFRQSGENAAAAVSWRQVLRYPNWQVADSAGALKLYQVLASQTENGTLSISDRIRLTEFPDSLIFAIALKDTITNHIGISTIELRLRNFYTAKAEISDMVLARRIEQPPGEIHFRRDQLGIFSNLDNRYYAGEPIWLYFEIYNLARGGDGKTSYSIRQVITEKRAGGVLRALKDVVSGRDLKEVVMTYSGASIETDENRILRIDLSEFEAGAYSMTIEIEDLISGASASSSEEIVIYR